MRLFLTFGFIFISQYFIFSQYWVQKSSFGGVGRHRAVGCASKNRGYLGLGHVNGTGVDISYKDWWEYDPASDSWSQKANYPVNNYGAVSFVVDEKPIIGGGSALGGEFYQFDPLTNTWHQIASCPFFNPGDVQGFSVNNKGYIYMGNQLAEYEPISNSWNLKASAPISFSTWSCAFAIEGSGFVKSGNKLYEYKPSHDQWLQRADFPGNSTGGSSAFSINQKGFVTCGYVGSLSNVTEQVWSYSPGTNSWQVEIEFPGTSRRFPVAFSIHQRGYFGTGTNGINLNDFWQFNPINNTLSISENTDIQVLFYPNPTKDFINVKTSSTAFNQLTIRNFKGQIVKNIENVNNSIYVGDLPEGPYFVSILLENNQIITEKILIQ
jgi:N-acetylneuraminic acid mutarotase